MQDYSKEYSYYRVNQSHRIRSSPLSQMPIKASKNYSSSHDNHIFSNVLLLTC